MATMHELSYISGLTVESAAPTVDARHTRQGVWRRRGRAIPINGRLLPGVPEGGDDPFADDADAGDVILIYVALVKNPDVATVSISYHEYTYSRTPRGNVIAGWWDSLTCRERNNALGKRGGAEAQPRRWYLPGPRRSSASTPAK